MTTASRDLDPLGAALLELAERPERAAASVAELASGGDELAAAIHRHLADPAPGEDVYVDPEGFRRFISGGGNVPLYAATSAALAARYPEGPFTLLDLGTGDGRAARPAVEPHQGPVDVDAVEPSDELRAALVTAVEGSSHRWHLHGATAEQFLATGSQRWEVAESTFALHNLHGAELAQVLAALRGRVDRLVVVEFDVPQFAGQRDPARVAYCVDRYRAGLAEYPDDPVVVAGFLVPVLLGGLDTTVSQTTWEQPAEAWVAALEAAGFGSVTVEPVFDYWWAPAVALTAR